MPDPRRPLRPKLQRLAAGALLLAEERARKDVQDAVERQIAVAAAEAERRHQDERRAAILALLLLGAKAMAADVQKAILGARDRARGAARIRLAAELRAVGIVLAAHHWVLGYRGDIDDAHAQSAAESLASQWGAFAIAQVFAGSHKGVGPAEAIRGTRKSMLDREWRTAATESGQAYNDEHKSAIVELMGFDEQFRDGEIALRGKRLVREWSALLDACPRCWPYDGTTTPIGQSFKDGAEPGFMHPRCRCIDVLVEAPL